MSLRERYRYRTHAGTHLPSLKIQMLGKILKLRILTYKFVYDKACPSGFHTHKSACKLSLGLLSHCSSKITGKRGVTLRRSSGVVYETL